MPQWLHTELFDQTVENLKHFDSQEKEDDFINHLFERWMQKNKNASVEKQNEMRSNYEKRVRLIKLMVQEGEWSSNMPSKVAAKDLAMPSTKITERTVETALWLNEWLHPNDSIRE